jgi:hypothetical protein
MLQEMSESGRNRGRMPRIVANAKARSRQTTPVEMLRRIEALLD